MADQADLQRTRDLGIAAFESELRRRGATLTKLDRSTFEVSAGGKREQIGIWCSNGYGWQQSLTRFLVIHDDGSKQRIELLPLARPDRLYVFVWLGTRHHEPNRYFMLKAREVQEVMRAGHQWWLDQHDGTRPVKPESTHHNFSTERLEQFENRWELIGCTA